MKLEDEEKFKKSVNWHQVERCCGTCKWFDRDYEASGCKHQKQAEFDELEQMLRKNDPGYDPECYGAYGGIDTDEGKVCDLWETSNVPHGKEGV